MRTFYTPPRNILTLCRTGTDYAKYLSVKHGVPLIPIHHMEAHALTARMVEKVLYQTYFFFKFIISRIHFQIPFPFMVLLISGGHCLLAIAQVRLKCTGGCLSLPQQLSIAGCGQVPPPGSDQGQLSGRDHRQGGEEAEAPNVDSSSPRRLR